uniref:Uncharacterized protein n=1 Tax=Amphilophus citrinellus TaxID=61819 RepID=A0A3Q0T0W9_AMPCI
MPEVRDLSEALPEMPMDPITGVGVVASRNRAPTGYDVVSHRTQLRKDEFEPSVLVMTSIFDSGMLDQGHILNLQDTGPWGLDLRITALY